MSVGAFALAAAIVACVGIGFYLLGRAHGQEHVRAAYHAGYQVGRAGREPREWEGP